MNQTLSVQPRRSFLRYLGMASSLAMSGSMLWAQQKRKFPEPPPPAAGAEGGAAAGDPQAVQRAQLKLNEQEFRESLSHLYQRVSELKQDVEMMHTTDVFSVKVYKQTGEIEHLAKRLRSLAKI